MNNQHQQKFDKLNTRVAQLYEQGQYAAALEPAREAVDLTRTHFGEDDPQYATALNDLGVLLVLQKDYKQAQQLHLKAIDIRREVLGDKHPDYAESLQNLAFLYNENGLYVGASLGYIEAAKIYAEIYGEKHQSYIAVQEEIQAVGKSIISTIKKINELSSQAKSLIDRASMEEAIHIANKARDLASHQLNKTYPAYASCTKNLARCMQAKGDYDLAEPLFKEVGEDTLKELGEEHPDYISSLSDLAVLYRQMHKFTDAELLFKKIILLRGKVLGKDHPDYAMSLDNLAQMYDKSGNRLLARSLLEEAMEITRKINGKEDTNFSNRLTRLANVNSDLGDYKKAELFFKEALEIRGSTVGKDHPDYAKSLDNLAELYRKITEYEKAEPLLVESVEIKREKFGENNLTYTSSIGALINLYRSMNRNDEAERLMRKVVGLNISEQLKTAAIFLEKNKPSSQAITETKYEISKYSEELPEQDLNARLNNLYGIGNYDEAFSLLGDVAVSRQKVLDAYNKENVVSRMLNNDSSKISELDLLLRENRNLKELSNNEEFLKKICACVKKCDLSLEKLPLTEELMIYQECVNSLLIWKSSYSPLENEIFSTETADDKNGTLILLEEIALQTLNQNQSVLSKKNLILIAQRYLGKGYETVLEDIKENSGILELLVNEDYVFSYRTFLEYFAARALYRRIEKHISGEWVEELLRYWNPLAFWQDGWTTCLRMFLGILPRVNHPEFLLICIRHLPEELGALEEAKISKGQPCLVVIGTNYISVDKNRRIARILHFLIETGLIQHMYTEGGEGPIDISFYRDMEKLPDEHKKWKIALKFLDEMTITPQEFTAITSRQDCAIWGIDNDEFRERLHQKFKEIDFNTGDVIGDWWKHNVEEVRGLSMATTLKSVMREKDVQVGALVIGAPYYLPIPNAYGSTVTSTESKETSKLSYIKIDSAGMGDDLEKYKPMVNGDLWLGDSTS